MVMRPLLFVLYADIYNSHVYPMLQGTPSAQTIDPLAGDQFCPMGRHR
jgi:hypothetical protein